MNNLRCKLDKIHYQFAKSVAISSMRFCINKFINSRKDTKFLSRLFFLTFFLLSSQFTVGQINKKIGNFVDEKAEAKQFAAQRAKADSIRKLQLKAQQDSIKNAQNNDPTGRGTSGLIEDGATQEENSLTLTEFETLPIPPGSKPYQPDLRPIDTFAYTQRMMELKMDVPIEQNFSEKDWSRKYFINHTNPYKQKHELDSNYQVFGWHPYWMGDAYKSYNYSLLSVVSYYGYEINPETGSYRSIHDWKTTALVDSARATKTKVLLTASLNGKQETALFLSSLNSQRTFIRTIMTLVRERNAHGVNINFEEVPANFREAYTNFLIDLSTSMKKTDPNFMFVLSLPAFDFDRVYDIQQIDKHIDLYVVTAFEFYGRNSQVAGPIMPMGSGDIWWELNAPRAIDEHLAAGANPKKLLLGVPYYGAQWETQDLTFPSYVKKFNGYLKYRDIVDTYGQLLCCEDISSGSKFHVFRDQRNRYQQIWYEDSTTLGARYDYVTKQKLGGIGIWALGYDNGNQELWKVIGKKFTIKEDETQGAGIKLSGGRIRGLIRRLIFNPAGFFRNPRFLLVTLGGLLGIKMGLIYMLSRFGCKFKNITNFLLKGGIVFLILIFVALIVLALQFAGSREVVFMIGGFLLAGIIFFIFSRRFLTEKELP